MGKSIRDLSNQLKHNLKVLVKDTVYPNRQIEEALINVEQSFKSIWNDFIGETNVLTSLCETLEDDPQGATIARQGKNLLMELNKIGSTLPKTFEEVSHVKKLYEKLDRIQASLEKFIPSDAVKEFLRRIRSEKYVLLDDILTSDELIKWLCQFGRAAKYSVIPRRNSR